METKEPKEKRTQKEPGKKKTIAYLQGLRCFGAVAVVLMAVSTGPWNAVTQGTWDFYALNLFDGLVRWPVPLFVMISGALFLGRDRSLPRLYGRYIFRIVAAYCIWSGLYAWVGGGDLREFVLGHYHLWYLWFLCGLYMISPFLGRIARDKRLCVYFLVLTGLFGNLLPRLVEAAGLYSAEVGAWAEALWGRGKLYFAMGYVFQFVLGWWLHSTPLTGPQRWCIYLCGLAGAVLTVWGTAALSAWKGTGVQLLYEAQSLPVTATAAALFVWCKQNVKTLPRLLGSLANCSFGIYLSHAMVIEFLAKYDITALTVTPWLAAPVLTVGVLAVCWLFTAILRKIPLLGRLAA